MRFRCWLAGGHDWPEEWESTAADPCSFQRRCRRDGCEKEQTRTDHVWGDWQPASGGPPCTLHISCQRSGCNEQHTRIDHVWGEPQRVGGSPCVSFVECQREGCDARKELEEHDWVLVDTEEAYAGTNMYHGAPLDVYATTRTYICRRCREGTSESEYERR